MVETEPNLEEFRSAYSEAKEYERLQRIRRMGLLLVVIAALTAAFEVTILWAGTSLSETVVLGFVIVLFALFGGSMYATYRALAKISPLTWKRIFGLDTEAKAQARQMLLRWGWPHVFLIPACMALLAFGLQLHPNPRTDYFFGAAGLAQAVWMAALWAFIPILSRRWDAVAFMIGVSAVAAALYVSAIPWTVKGPIGLAIMPVAMAVGGWYAMLAPRRWLVW